MFYDFGTLDKSRGIPENRGFSYVAWSGMVRRCYDITFAKRGLYETCSIDESFREFHDFDAWARKQVGFGVGGFQLDKDLLFLGNKIYSPEKCIFVPAEINRLIIKTTNQRILKKYPLGVSLNNKKTGDLPYISFISKRRKKVRLGSHATIQEAFLEYKKHRELYIKEVANEYKGKIDERAYKALMAYTVSITD